MDTFYFIESEALARIAKHRKEAEQDRLAILAEEARRRKGRSTIASWFAALPRPNIRHVFNPRPRPSV